MKQSDIYIVQCSRAGDTPAITLHKTELCPFNKKCQTGIRVDGVISVIDQVLSSKVRMRT